MKVILFYDATRKAKKGRLWEWCRNIGMRNRVFQPLRNENHILRRISSNEDALPYKSLRYVRHVFE